MAGGRFDKHVGKVLPGTYINFESSRSAEIVLGGARGTVIIPLPKADYGPAGRFIRLTAASPDAEAATLGHSIYDDDTGRQMLLIREAFKRAATVYVYILKEGTKATKAITMKVPGEMEDTSDNTLTATAIYGGSRGNALTVTVDSDPLGGWDVLVHLGGSLVSEYDNLKTVEDLIARNDPYIKFEGSGKLGAAAGENLESGTDAKVENKDITGFIDAWESVRFDTVAFPFAGEEVENVKQAALSKVKYLREKMGKGVQVVIPDAGDMDYEGVINVTNSVSLNGNDLSTEEACAWVAGATAGASNTESLTYVPYAGATAVVKPKTNEAAEDAVNKGEFFFALNEDDVVVVMYDINSLVTFTGATGNKKDKSYRKNRVIRELDQLQRDIQSNLTPNKFANNSSGWDVIEGIGKTILRAHEDAGAITNVSYDEDFLVDRQASKDDETYINVGVQPVDSAEKFYITVTTR